MKNFKEGKSFGSRGGFGGDKRGGGFSGGKRPSFGGGSRPSFGGGSRPSYGGDRPSEVFKTSCSDCQKSCEVPFRPSGDRPVFCSDCFGNKRGSSEDTRSNFETRSTYRDTPKPARTPSVDLTVVLAKLDTLIKAVEKLTEAKKEVVVAPEAASETTAEEKAAPKAKKVVKKVVAAEKPAKKVAAEKKPAKKVVAKKK
ncbi:hypothetical protein A3C87_03935 [Candidatus Kaiserbacteria bacterium RIFCSPHIGHO2_02_FULL_49_34]|uniref:CxxC-x17-CxxC domain-containing protein n=1 Tax=Candidatus Kaiserbacteria bacterium RIFCSPHIGHO2_02_FULL_49_34 TaxID=1798491 RepID=A0A1F6DMQ8_9BACT|nr:MAG: hypothetical protein A3C87_03935 [Candidatus Kaiserbacteria bacterium RIFCSPHIGHO2_02_FULL_49_34]